MRLGGGQCCGEKEKDGVAKGGGHWGAVSGGEGQEQLSGRDGGSWPGPGQDGHSDSGKGITACSWTEITRTCYSLRNAEQMEVSCLGQFCNCPHSAYHGVWGRKGVTRSWTGFLLPAPLRTFTFLFMKVLKNMEFPAPDPGWRSVGVGHLWPH